MSNASKTLLCRYHYDALDRLVGQAATGNADSARFYAEDRLSTEVQGDRQYSFMRLDDQPLAQQSSQGGAVQTGLLATDPQDSILTMLDANQSSPLAYTAYGHRPLAAAIHSHLGFNGGRAEPITGCYLLGNGYRAYNPVLMRFHNPDTLSPFEKGGPNPYAYCVGDPVNQQDRNGHFPTFKLYLFFPKGKNPFKGLKNWLGIRTPSAAAAQTTSASGSGVESLSRRSSSASQSAGLPRLSDAQNVPTQGSPRSVRSNADPLSAFRSYGDDIPQELRRETLVRQMHDPRRKRNFYIDRRVVIKESIKEFPSFSEIRRLGRELLEVDDQLKVANKMIRGIEPKLPMPDPDPTAFLY